MTLTTATDVATIRKAAEISTDILDTLRKSLSVGIYPSQIEIWQGCHKVGRKGRDVMNDA